MSGRSDSLTDQALAEMAKDGDRRAFDVLCNRHLPSVYNRLRALLPPEAVEDMTQEVFVAALQGLSQFRGQSSFRTWIAGIVRHKVADYYRKRNRQPEVVPLQDGTDTTEDTNAWEEHTLVRLALQRLPAHYQEVLLLRFAEGMPFRQIANVLDISLEATKSRYRRAVTALAQEMGVDHGRPRGGNSPT